MIYSKMRNKFTNFSVKYNNMQFFNEHASTVNVLIGFSIKKCHQIMPVDNEDVRF